MYQYVEEQRRKELKELKEAEEEVVQEFDKVKRKLKCIAEYKSLKDDQCGLLTLISVVTFFVAVIETGCIYFIMTMSKFGGFLGSSLAVEMLLLSIGCGCIGRFLNIKGC